MACLAAVAKIHKLIGTGSSEVDLLGCEGFVPIHDSPVRFLKDMVTKSTGMPAGVVDSILAPPSLSKALLLSENMSGGDFQFRRMCFWAPWGSIFPESFQDYAIAWHLLHCETSRCNSVDSRHLV